MRTIKQYGGVLLILLAVAILCGSFYADLDKGVYNLILLACAVLVILGVLLSVIGGKAADKIGGK